MNVGINGFGRIGRLAVRALREHPELHLTHVNEIKGGLECAAHLLDFDTVHGRFPGEISVEDGGLRIDDRAASYSEHPEPGDIPWADLGVDIVLECSGQWRTIDTLTPHLDAGARRVIVAAPVKGGVPNIVMGCNEDSYDPAIDRILTAASCTTNCLAPVVKVIHESFGIEHGVITTIHDATNTQVVVDSPHRDLRRARSALNALIPTSTGSATAITMIYPELKGRLDGIAIRVPLLNASLLDAVFTVKKSVTVVEVNDALRVASEGSLEGILGFETRPLVSTDFVNDPRSGIIDAPSTMVIGDRMVKILAWYDNEYGYACRLVDLASRLATQLRILLG
ncbi:MAG: ArsJ-associated glyceraldehyde-3-phosphate dehydrogenase [Planctomycetota bacterium]|nr:ArsJ-associated glyceraldehyde-3-phosphate dehydrogenase [Planctomycetota bacterium]